MTRVVDLAHMVWPADIVDLEATCREVAQAGFRCVVLNVQMGQLDLRDREQAMAAGRTIRRCGLTAPACHGLDTGAGGLNDPDEDARAALVKAHVGFMANAVDLGSRTYVVHIGPSRADEPREASWDRIRRSVDELARQAEALGIIVALENGLPNYIVTNQELVSLVAEYDHPAIGICYDSGHAHVMGDAAGALRDFAPHVVTVHLHDNDGEADQHLIPGQGTINWPAVVEALALCPNLRQAETEAANSSNWPPTREVWEQHRVFERYREVLNPPGAAVRYE